MVQFSKQPLIGFKLLLYSCLQCISTHPEYYRRHLVTNTRNVLFCCILKRFVAGAYAEVGRLCMYDMKVYAELL